MSFILSLIKMKEKTYFMIHNYNSTLPYKNISLMELQLLFNL